MNETVTLSAIDYSAIQKALSEAGYYHLKTPLSEADFAALCEALGQVQTRSIIEVDKQAMNHQIERRSVRSHERPSTYSNETIGYHTDSPQQPLLAWHCLRQDERDGALLLLDVYEFLATLSPAEIQLLGSIELGWTKMVDGVEHAFSHPLVSKLPTGRYTIYYAPWFLPDEFTSAQQIVLSKLQAWVENQVNPVKIRLNEGEAILADNQRMLHARETISPTSQRKIVRVSIIPEG